MSLTHGGKCGKAHKQPNGKSPATKKWKVLGRTIGPVSAKFLYGKPQQSARERAVVVDSALQPTWRGSPRADFV
ncbi:MAG: hypothetical protein ACK55Z_16145, partial [bacterium]